MAAAAAAAAAATAVTATTATAAAKGEGERRELSKAQLKREKRRERRQKRPERPTWSEDESAGSETAVSAAAVDAAAVGATDDETDDETATTIELDLDDPLYAQFRAIFVRFGVPDGEDGRTGGPDGDGGKGEVYYSDDEVPMEEDMDEEEEEKTTQQLSKKKTRKLNKLTVARLKQMVEKPDLVEWTDVDSKDPLLLVHLKTCRNSVPVPAHWQQKRDYLSSKRGIEKPPFELPDFIKATGIMEMRDTARESEEGHKLRDKMRERVKPKMGKLDVDYQKLHDAFFKFQTKPPLTGYGEVYYEGKEWETNIKEKRPGELSDELKEALNIPPGAPPPWLINMQRFGPPPSFSTLKIPGLNAALPSGAQWGFHPGGWGKPPVDEFNRPLYGGDVFGVMAPPPPAPASVPTQRALWGQLEDMDEEDEDEDEDETMEENLLDGAVVETDEADGKAMDDGLASSTSTTAGMATPAYIELRK